MPSIADFHFPQMVWREGNKLLWNPIHKKALKNRPEERVRLRIIEALIAAGWSKHRISTEEALKVRESAGGRTDIICYDQDFRPQILVECKAESVPISSDVAEQTARYNRTVGAPYLLMSNGITDHWYEISDPQSLKQLPSPPDLLKPTSQHPERNFQYWKQRGFAGEKAQPNLRDWLTGTLNYFWLGQAEEPRFRFIGFNNSPTDMELSHYFKIKKLEECRIATGFLSTPFGGSRLFGVINQEKENVALVELNLDLLGDNTKPNGTLYWENGPANFNFRDFHAMEISHAHDTAVINKLPESLHKVYQHLSDE